MIEVSAELNRVSSLNDIVNSLNTIIEKGEHSDTIHEKISRHVAGIQFLLEQDDVKNLVDSSTFQTLINQANSFIGQ